jgi:hypothetical protein
MRVKHFQLLIGLIIASLALTATTLSSRFSINNTGGKVEFGQGLVHTVACDTHIPTELITKIDTATGSYFIDSLILKDLSIRLQNRTLKVKLLNRNDAQLNQKIEFSVGSDGLTYTSESSHIDNLEAFELGGGANRETGTSTITFDNLRSISNSRIPAGDVSTVTLETSGYDECSTPSNTRALDVYIDAPNVQGSYIAESFTAASLTDNYNGTTGHFVDCPTSATVGSYSFSGNGCKVLQRTENNGDPYPYGGAITSSSNPATGGAAASQTASAGSYTSAGTTITFSTRKNYLGFWWSAGSYGNEIKFYRGSTLVATMTGDDVYTALPNNSTTTLTAIDSTTAYTASAYRGHPINTASPRLPQEPFVYIHAFAVNGFNFDKISFGTTGDGFEWDNLTVANLSTTQLSPKRTLVLNKTYDYTG